MYDLCDRNGVNMFFPFKVMAVNGLLFSSMFFGIRGMANTPVESMKFGGLGWFTDLTVSDPIMLLPVSKIGHRPTFSGLPGSLSSPFRMGRTTSGGSFS